MEYGTGGQFSFPGVSAGMTQEEVINVVAKMQKELTWLLNNMDSANVPRLNTDVTQIQSADGETLINGPLLQMYDAAATLRLNMGLNKTTTNFTFDMFNILGTQTLGIDSNGDATFTGTITGGTIQTALPNNARLTLTSAGLTSYNSSNQKNGFSIEPGFLDFSQMGIYEGGASRGKLSYDLTGNLELAATNGVNLSLYADNNLYLNCNASGAIILEEKVQFNGTTIGFFGTTPVIKTPVADPSAVVTTQVSGATYTANEQTMLANLKTDVTNLRTKVKGICDALQGYGLI
jgi:hypothetical protein